MLDRVRGLVRAYRKRFGLFGIVFPILLIAVGAFVVVLCLEANGTDVLGWLASEKAIPVYFAFLIVALALVGLWTAA